MSYESRRNIGLAIALRALYRYTELFWLYRASFAGRGTDALFLVLGSTIRDPTYNI